MEKKSSSLKRKHLDFFSSEKKLSDIPWVEEFCPRNIDDLAVHKKKISDVQSWLQTNLNRHEITALKKEPPILLLTGPPGVGKTATIKVLCKSLKVELFTWSNTNHRKAWKNRDDDMFVDLESCADTESQTTTFSRFLLHSTKYSLFSSEKKVILVEEFPNTALKNSEEFHYIIRKFALCGKHPAVFIISDNTKGESLEYRLFPKELQNDLKITNISFNPVAPTLMVKTLTRINASSKVETKYMKLNKSQLEGIASDSMGDIRNAINSMQFMCMTEFKKPDPVIFKKPESQPKKVAKSDDCTLKRDSSLFLFHALGKVLYCKRDSSLKTDSDRLPETLRHLEKNPLISNPEDIYEKTSISSDGFTLFLQENYIPFVENVEIAAHCSNWLSEADTLSAEWSGKETMNSYMTSLAARGLMFNITSQSSNRQWRPLHKPQFYENNSKTNRLIRSLKRTFKGSSLSIRELQIDLIPFASKMQNRSLNFAQLGLAKELGEMNVKRFYRLNSKTLDEKDCFDDDNCNLELPSQSKENNYDTDAPLHDDDEEIVIEEYDF